MAEIVYRLHPSPIGQLLLAGFGDVLTRIGFPSGKGRVEPAPEWRRDDEALAPARAALDAYFADPTSPIGCRLEPVGTPFQREVWAALREIAPGRTTTYADLARLIGRPRAIRAVGAANGANPLPILIPCHRVVGHDGTLTGFGGGLPTKAWLLAWERGERRPPPPHA